MAGAGVRVFQPGEVLTAALVNTYLQDQVVCRFDDVADRDSSFGGAGQPTLEEGRICYLDSTNELQYFDGTVWVSISPEAVTGSITAKGDLVVGTAPNTISRLAVGANNFVLTADSSTATGIKWSAITVPDDSVTTAKLTDSSVTNDKIADNAVTSDKIANNTIVNADVSATAAIDLAKLADVVIDNKTANYILALGDKNKIIEMNMTTSNTVTIPPNSGGGSVAFPIGTQITIIQMGTGKTQVVAGVPATTNIRATPGVYLRAQSSSATLIKRAAEEWYLIGDLSAT